MTCDARKDGQRGSVMFYIFLAIALLAALTFFFTRDTRDNASVQTANKIAQELYVQSNLIRSAIVECTLSYPEGAGDVDGDGLICSDTSGACASKIVDNANAPFPLNPYLPTTHTNLTLATFSPAAGNATDNIVRNVSCLIPPVPPATNSTQRLIFQGTGSQARFLPPPPSGWPEWTYSNDPSVPSAGVSISIIPPADGTSIAAANMLATKFNLTLAQACWTGSGTFTVWIQKANSTCP
jgi:hypothetical protein